MTRILILILSTLLSTQESCQFVPHDLIKHAIHNTNTLFDNTPFGYVSQTFTHEEIIKRGIIRSVAKYFYDQPGGRYLIDLKRIESDYYQSVKRLYNDYYGAWYCKIELERLIDGVFQKMVVKVDMNDGTKDLPYAHFDAETFYLSNDRVIMYKQKIMEELRKKNPKGYRDAANYAGVILHTIHDFYSHSNWIEMGNYNNLNLHIGQPTFKNLEIADKNDITCYDNCQLVTKECDQFTSLVSDFVRALELNAIPIKCPIQYYNCSNNITPTSKLISGFYVNQRLRDGTEVKKPVNSKKCSHGGIQDTTSNITPKGGINKDSGFLILSPHAHLHEIAASLAIRHTELFFNEIRSLIGDREFGNFLSLKMTRHSIRNKLNQYIQVCKGSRVDYSLLIFLIVALNSLREFLKS